MLRVIVIALLALAAPARADIPSPEVEACMGKEPGDRCQGGACTKQTCSRSRPGPDGTMQTSTWECVMCTPGAGGSDGTLRLGIGIGVAVLVIGGGVLLARFKMKAAT